MPALQNLPLSHYELQMVLLPGKANKPVAGIRIIVFGECFPIRALQPEILVGEQSAQRVDVSRDQRSIRGYLLERPPDGALIRVRYGESQEGELRERFDSKRIQPLPEDCR
jgi:hypothetical protein